MKFTGEQIRLYVRKRFIILAFLIVTAAIAVKNGAEMTITMGVFGLLALLVVLSDLRSLKKRVERQEEASSNYIST